MKRYSHKMNRTCYFTILPKPLGAVQSKPTPRELQAIGSKNGSAMIKPAPREEQGEKGNCTLTLSARCTSYWKQKQARSIPFSLKRSGDFRDDFVWYSGTVEKGPGTGRVERGSPLLPALPPRAAVVAPAPGLLVPACGNANHEQQQVFTGLSKP